MKPKMHTKKINLALLALLPLWATAPAQQQEIAADTPKLADKQENAAPLAQDEELLTGRLENGLSYVIRHTQEPAGRGSVRLLVRVGSLHETEVNSGISHFLEHMVFNGSRTFKRGELIPTMQKLGLGFGGDANAYTSLLQTVYMLDLPNLDEKTVDFALTIMRDFADGATLEDSAIDHERGIVVSELKSRDSASYRAMIALLEQLSEGTRLAQYMPIGREEVIRDAPYEVVRSYYRDHYVPERMTLVITGDFDPATAEEWVKKHFGAMQARTPRPMPPMGELKLPIRSERLIPNPEAGSCSVMASVVRPWVKKADTIEQRVEDMPLRVALGMLNRRLSRLSRKENCPFISARAEDEGLFHVAQYTGLSVSSAPENWKPALELALQQVRQAIKYGFDEQELKETAAIMLTTLQQRCDSWQSVPAKEMATQLVKELAEEEVLTAPQEDLRAAKIGLERIFADPDLCRRALEKHLVPADAALTMTGNLPEDATTADLRSVYDAALQTEVPEPTSRVVKPFAYETIGMPGTVTAQTEIADLGATLITLSNGVRVNLKPADFRKGSIHVAAAVDGGTLALPETPGLAAMVNAVMSRGGLQEHSMEELEQLFAGNRVTLNFTLNQTRFVYTGSTNMKDLELQCKLMAAAILYPGYRPEGEMLLRRGLDNRYKELTTTPQGATAMQMPRKLFGEDVRFVIPTREQVEARSTQEVKEAISPMLRENALEVSLVGDFKVEDVLPVLERTFGAMPQRKAEFTELPAERRRVHAPAWPGRCFLHYPTELDKTIVTQVRPAGNGRDRRRNRRLQVLASMVREKLFDGLRAVMGESYSPSVRVSAYSEIENAAYITCTSAGVKRNRAKVSAAMESICNGIGQGQLTAEDFDCAIRPFISATEKAVISPDFWDEAMLDLQSNPERAELVRDAVKDARSITYEEMQELAREVFGKDNASFFYTVPEGYQEDDRTEPTPTEPAAAANEPPAPAPAPGEYLVLTTRGTAAETEWRRVADTLVAKYPGAKLCILPEINEEALTHALREHGARYAALVLRPGEIGRETVNDIHRATRKLDDDPYGDCIWGIVTGYRASDAQRVADAKKPLTISRLLSTTNVHYARFEHSYCITDWEGFPVLEQSGHREPTKTTFTPNTPEGLDIIENGIHEKFAEQLSTQWPQFVVTSSHATPFNLEMPFGKGLIFSCNNRFHMVGCKQFCAFTSALQPAMSGNVDALNSLQEAMQFPTIRPDSTQRVWLAAGNCLIGDAHHTDQSMVITAMSAYGCNQFVGYTVPSWYGEGGWGTLELFMGNTDGTTLAEAFFLNNQFLLHKTLQLDPKLLSVQFNEPQIGPALQRDLQNAQLTLRRDQHKDALGLVHDRDTLAFFGDPAWVATVDSAHEHAPLSIQWQSDKHCTLTANMDYSGRAAIWFPHAAIGHSSTGCDLPGAVFTNDFILIPELKLKKGEKKEIHLK